MKAVNLIPDEQRRGAGGQAGRSGGVAYAIVGVLAGLVAMVAVYAMANGTITTRKAKLAALTTEVAQSQTQNTELQAYTAFASLAQSRQDTISQIIETRFDWAHALREIPRVLPKDVWLESMAGTVAPTQSASSASSTTTTEPAIDLQGCTTSQDEVATLMTALRQIDGVDQVNLTKSAKSDTASAGGGSCTVKTSYPSFDITVSFLLPGAVSPTGTTTATPDNSPSAALGTTSSSTPVAATTPEATATSGGGQG
jgi:Tfp pilus assembly protein PilN